jgi:exonuclease SbcC
VIKSLSAVNFRRHAELDLRFDDDRQLILVSGANGVGKTSILEAITFALWGEGRHGRRNLDNLVRRGAELEGMSVELTFTVGDDTYRVHRRRDGKAVTAVLYANDIPLVEGPLAVTAEIGAILGMDAAGFRLAVIAQQKDLDGLASLRPAERAQMITRLLRLDALTAARNAAAARFRSERDIAAGLRGPDVAALRAELATTTEELTAASGELEKTRAAFAVLDAEIIAGAAVEDAYNAAQQAVARIEGAIGELDERRRGFEHDLAFLVVPDVVAEVIDAGSLATDAAEIERAIAHAENLEQALRQRKVAEEELADVSARLDIIAKRLAELGVPDEAPVQAEIAAARFGIAGLEASVEELRLRLGSLQGRLEELQSRDAAAGALGDECTTCGQTIPEEHRDAHHHRLQEEITRVTSEIEQVRIDGRAAVADLAGERERIQVLEKTAAALRADAAERVRLVDEHADLERRARIYAAQIERIDVTPVDLDALYVRKAELAVRVARSEEYARQTRQRDAALTRRDELVAAMAAVDADISERATQLESARPGADLQARFDALRASIAKRAEEEELLRHWTTEAARLQERQRSLTGQIAAADAIEARRLGHETTAVHASAAARLLADVSERLATQIRPSLEGAVSTLLATMSDGRFSIVKISDEYQITVDDDGKFRPLAELSGGEVDLVALAVRLALAQVVSERHGSGGAGFLILDECFASQDATRRQSILAALRNLRDVYSQIFLISHVENIEDAADLVVEVTATPDRTETEVTIS